MVLTDALVKAAYSASHSGIESGEEVLSWILLVLVWGLYLILAVLGCFAAFSEASSSSFLKHFMFHDFKPTSKSRLTFSLIILHRMFYALLIIALDNPKLQLILLSLISLAVTPSQHSTYLLIVMPYQDIRNSILQLGAFLVVTGFLVVLTLFEFELVGSDKELVTTSFMWCIMAIISLHVLAILAKLATTAKEIYGTEGQVPLIAEV
jgi:hypothetical protein